MPRTVTGLFCSFKIMNENFSIDSLNEKAICIETGNNISPENHQRVLSLQQFIHQLFIPGFIETVPAYCSLTIYYNPLAVIHSVPESKTGVSKWMINYLQNELNNWQPGYFSSSAKKIIEIPVCYDDEYGLDINEVAQHHQTSKEEIIRRHTSQAYHVYMMGFSPGFPYMGILNDDLATPRKNQPRLNVPAGSVAIAGIQTGIYPLQSPGGWNIIGRTPLKLFDKKNTNPFLLNTGDEIKFVTVTKDAFEKLL